MNRYIATFHTHYAAMVTCRALRTAGIEATLAPVPRALSADCGTCARYEAEQPHPELMHRDYEQIMLVNENGTMERVAHAAE